MLQEAENPDGMFIKQLCALYVIVVSYFLHCQSGRFLAFCTY